MTWRTRWSLPPSRTVKTICDVPAPACRKLPLPCHHLFGPFIIRAPLLTVSVDPLERTTSPPAVNELIVMLPETDTVFVPLRRTLLAAPSASVLVTLVVFAMTPLALS